MTLTELKQLARAQCVEAIVEGLLIPGLVLLVGAPKTGKSRFAVELMGAVATGGPFLGTHRVLQSRSVYYMIEPTPHDVAETVSQYGYPEDVDVDFIPMSGGIPFEEFAADLRDKVAANPDVRVVVVDMADRLELPAGVGTRNENGYELSRNTFWPYQALAKELQVALVLIMHSGSNSTRPIGGNGVVGTADIVWTLERDQGATGGKLTVTGRSVKERTIPLRWDTTVGRWSDIRSGVDAGRMVVDISGLTETETGREAIAKVADQIVGGDWVDRPSLIERVDAGVTERGLTVSRTYLERELDNHLKLRVQAGVFQRKQSRPVAFRRVRRASQSSTSPS